MVEYDRSTAPLSLALVETMRVALREIPVAIAEVEEALADGSFGEIAIFPTDADIEII